MQTNQDIIQFLSSGFWVCLILGIIFLVLSIVMFFAFDIKTVYEIRTGKLKKRTIEKIQNKNSKTGEITNKNTHFNFTGDISTDISEPLHTAYNAPVIEQALEQTTLLERDNGYTVPLAEMPKPVEESFEPTIKDPVDVSKVRFNIVKCIMFIHTEEDIS